MDANRFDGVTRALAASRSRRGVLGAAGAALLAMLGGGLGADAQVTQVQCGNRRCKNDPGTCAPGCVCCLYANGNNRCRPAGTCGPGVVLCPDGSTVPPDRPCPTCQTAVACAVDADCAPGQACRNGGCFTPCPEFGFCGEGCSGCTCRWSIENQSQLYCADVDAFIGFCSTTADCPAGSVCDSSFEGQPRRCTRACPVRR